MIKHLRRDANLTVGIRSALQRDPATVAAGEPAKPDGGPLQAVAGGNPEALPVAAAGHSRPKLQPGAVSRERDRRKAAGIIAEAILDLDERGRRRILEAIAGIEVEQPGRVTRARRGRAVTSPGPLTTRTIAALTRDTRATGRGTRATISALCPDP